MKTGFPAKMFAVLGAAGALLPAAFGWALSDAGVKWPDGQVPMVFMLGPPKTLSDGTSWNIAAQWALEEWNRNIARTQFTWTTSAATQGDDNNNVNEVFFSADVYGTAWSSSTLAITSYWRTSTRITRADVLFNSGKTWDSYRGALHYSGITLIPDFRRVALHEFGHVLGFDHPDDVGQSVTSIMNASVSGVENLTANDKEGAAATYGPTAENPLAPPVITFHPQPISTMEGTVAQFSVTATGASLTYQWRKDGVAVSGTSAFKSISAVKPSDAGDYSVVVTNPGGSVTSNAARLTVTALLPPTILSGPYSGTYVEGTTASLTVSATSTGLQYQWRRDGQNIAGATGAKLDLTSLQLWDAGKYDVIVSNASGSATSGQANVQVEALRPPYIVEQPGAVAFWPGDSASMPATVHGSSSMQHVWTRDGTTVATVTGSTNTSYNITTSNPTPAGIYRLTSTNNAGTAQSGPIEAIALPAKAPYFTYKQPNKSVVDGSSYSFSIGAAGKPTPTYVWKKDGVTIASASGSNPYFSPATTSSAGTYSVTASNSAGSVTHSFQVTVTPAPPRDIYFRNAPGQIKVNLGDNTALTCQLSDSSGATYRWYKDGVLLPNTNSNEYRINNASAAHVGRYAVEADVAGQTVRSEEGGVELLGASRPEINSVSGAAIGYALDATYIGFSPVSSASGAWVIQWYRDGVAVPGATTTSIGLYTVADSGTYTAQFTHGGGSVTSPPVKVVIRSRPVPTIQLQPGDTTIAMGDTANLTVYSDWGISHTWKKDGVPISGAGSSNNLSLGPASASTAGNYTVEVRNAAGSVESQVAHVDVRPGEAPIVRKHPQSIRSSINNSPYITVEVAGTNPISLVWKKNGVVLPAGMQSGNNLYFFPTSPSMAGNYTVVATNAFGSVESNIAVVEYDGVYGSPLITRQPQNTTGVLGQVASIAMAAWGSPAPTIQWRRNGVNIAGATKWKLDLPNAQYSDAGSYDAVITNSQGTVTSQSANLTITVDNGRIVALSARAQVGTGADVLIPGFNVGGSVPKKLLIRALGPTLTSYGVVGALADPKLEVKALGSSTILASNDDWTGVGSDPTLASVFTQIGASTLATGTKDAAVIATLPPGLYTAVTSGNSNGTGIALLEVFDLDPAAGKLTGISTRAVVGTGSNVLIPGIVVEGPVAKKLLIRVSGPTLGSYGVPGTLADPKLELKNSAGTTIVANDNWNKDDAAYTGAIAAIGLNPFLTGSKDAGILATLNAGLYTIVISGADGGSGVALVEVYEIP